MFLEKNVVEFINKIILESKEEGLSKIKENIETFRDYLQLTKMANEAVIAWINQVVDCLPEIISLRKKVNNIDILMIVPFEGVVSEKEEKLVQLIKKKYEEKHYHHYHEDTSSNCGSSGNGKSRSGC